jgi:hypothetical protein
MAALAIITLTIRAVLLIVGIAVVIAPSFLLLQFAYGVGEPPSQNQVAFFVPTLGIGLVLGGGLVLVGLPRVVAGATTPIMRVLSGAMLITSAVLLAALGFSGSITKIVSPLILLSELVAFLFFVYPAKRFSQSTGAENG